MYDVSSEIRESASIGPKIGRYIENSSVPRSFGRFLAVFCCSVGTLQDIFDQRRGYFASSASVPLFVNPRLRFRGKTPALLHLAELFVLLQLELARRFQACKKPLRKYTGC